MPGTVKKQVAKTSALTLLDIFNRPYSSRPVRDAMFPMAIFPFWDEKEPVKMLEFNKEIQLTSRRLDSRHDESVNLWLQ